MKLFSKCHIAELENKYGFISWQMKSTPKYVQTCITLYIDTQMTLLFLYCFINTSNELHYAVHTQFTPHHYV